MENEYPLFTLLIEVTQKCNAACEQCGSRCDVKSREFLSKEDILSALKDIKDKLGTGTMINITGGEPLMRRDLFELTSQITALGFDWGMVTNGSLITRDVIEKMKSSGMKTVTVSIDGLRETHEDLRKLPGSFDKIITALTELKKEKFLDHLQVTFTANHRNVHEFPALYRILSGIGIDSVRVGLMDPIGRAKEHPELLPTREDVIYFTGIVKELTKFPGALPVVWGCPHYFGDLVPGRKFKCFAGTRTASILWNGDIFVCPNVQDRERFRQGNILTDSFADVWKNGFEFFRERRLPAYCAGCRHNANCLGDSVHTMDFDTGIPQVCYKKLFEEPDPEGYKNRLFAEHPGMGFLEIAGDEKTAEEIIIEPEAYRAVREYFHIGKASPLSMYEQQMALAGFYEGDTAIVRYVIPCDGKMRIGDNAIFTKDLLKKAASEINVINKNYFLSDDAGKRGCMPDYKHPIKFLGFIHSHPLQENLVYSIGDDIIHKRLYKKYGGYTGILIHPPTGKMGAYSGRDIKQIRLIIPEEV